MSRAYCRSSLVWVAATIVRKRALSRATVGKPMLWAKTPWAKSASDIFAAVAAWPTITGVIGLSLRPVLKPSDSRPALKKRVLSQSCSIHCGSLSSTSIAAMQAAVTAGGCEVENRNGRAR